MGSGFKDFAAGDVLTAADVDGYLMRQTVMTFADASARDTALSGVLDEGMVAYLEDTDVFSVYDGSSWFQYGPGKILQVVQGQSTVSFTTSSTSMVDVTDVTLSITPSATTSKVFVIVTGIAGNANAVNSTALNIVRDSTAIGIGTGGTFNQSGAIYLNNANGGSGFALSHLDSPATTSATTYKLQAMSITAGTAVIGRVAVTDTVRVPTTITAFEVSA